MAFANLKTHTLRIDLSSSPERPTEQSPRPNTGGKTKIASERKVVKRAKRDHKVDEPTPDSGGLPAAEAAPSESAQGEAAHKQNRGRNLVCEKLKDALGGGLPAAALAAQIEEALHLQLGEGKEYASQARAILYNLKEAGGGSLRQKLLAGCCEPGQLPRMTAVELLSDAKSSEKTRAQQAAAEASMVKADAQVETDTFTCEACSSTRTKYNTTAELRTYGAQQKMISVSHVTCLACGQSWVTR
mmetsp:Transcript_3678/g.9395  ORF Transcript_3678/g.9395 Transcript_3678/m.9395 type:complete len:244 (+) Transcript_3678:93-824(+)